MEQEKPSVEQIRELILKYQEKTGVSTNALSNKVGIANSTLSSFLKGEYPGDNTRIAGVLLDWYDLEVQRETIGNDFEFIETEIALQVKEALDYARLVKRIVMITSLPGAGKSYALYHYTRNLKTLFITVRPTMSTHDFMYSLADVVKVSVRNNTDMILKRVSEELLRKPRTLVLDEAQHLSVRSLNSIRYVWDISKTPLLISGNDELIEEIKRDPRYMQFTSRLHHLRLLPKVTFDEAKILIKQRFSNMTESLMMDIYQSSVSTRALTDIIITLDVLRKMNHEEPTKETVTTAMNFKLAANY